MQINQEDFVQYLTIKKRLAPKTVDTYRIRFLVVKRWLISTESDLTKYSFEKFLFELKEKKLSNAALNTYIQAIKHLEGFCKDRGLPIGFTEGIENMPKTHPEIIILSVEEIQRLIDTELEYKNRNGVDCRGLDMKYRTLAKFIAITACRFEEAASLQIKRLDIANGRATLVKTKNGDNRYVYFNGPIKQDLEYLIKGRSLEDLVFTNSRGKHVKPGDYNNDLRVRASKAGITKYVHNHILRHSTATHWLVAGVDIAMVSTLLGHKDIKTTFETYVHLADETLQAAAMRGPLVRQYVDPREILNTLRQVIEGFKLGNDPRFKVLSSGQGDVSLTFDISIVNS